MNPTGQRLLLVDQSLKGPGGHHFDYVLQTVKASVKRQRPIWLATHRRFRDTDAFQESLAEITPRPASEAELRSDDVSLHADLHVMPQFHLTTYSRWSDLDGLRRMTPRRVSWPQQAKDFLRHREARLLSAAEPLSEAVCRSVASHLLPIQQLIVTVFCRDLVQYLKQVRPQPDDALFFTTVSELEFLGMGMVAMSHPELATCQWHVQFHFDLFSGRPHEYAAQANRPETARAVNTFQRGREALAEQAVHFYTTSQTLADQYNWLRIGRFEPLPYPINPRFKLDGSQLQADTAHRPLRVTLAGGQRREKGQQQLQQVIEGLADPVLRTGEAKLVVQRSQRSKWRKPALDYTLPPVSSSEGEAATLDWIEYVGHPLGEQDYVDLIRGADIGLLLYDSRTYYARRAGVLGEFLACGVPVVVPSACWLADQVESANRPYWKGLFDEGTPLEVGTHGASATPIMDLEAEPDWSAIICRIATSASRGPLNHLTIGWQPLSGELRGTWGTLDRWPATLDSQGEAWCLLPVFPSREPIPYRLSLRWTFSEEPFELREIELRRVESHDVGEIPWGDIGLVALDTDQIPALVSHLCRQHPHFRAAALQHARHWFESHDPLRTVDRLCQPLVPGQSPAEERRAA